MSKVREINWKQFGLLNDLASYQPFSNWCPAVYEKDRWGDDKTIHRGYGMRILVSRGQNFRTGHTNTSWDYFETDPDGLITSSPRGMGKEFNKKVRIVDIADMVEHYKELKVNE